jgi:hypothetical protein
MNYVHTRSYNIQHSIYSVHESTYLLLPDISCFVLPRWTQEELKKVIAMLRLHKPEFDSKNIDPDLHKRMDKAVHDGSIKCFKMRESNADISTLGLVSWQMLCGRLWKIQWSKATRTLNLKWIWMRPVNCSLEAGPMLKWHSRLAN